MSKGMGIMENTMIQDSKTYPWGGCVNKEFNEKEFNFLADKVTILELLVKEVARKSLRPAYGSPLWDDNKMISYLNMLEDINNLS